jgi:hypothetical protein
MEQAELLAAIGAAFPVEPRPNMTLRQAALGDETMSREISEEEWVAAGNRDHHLLWSDLSPQDLIDGQIGLAFLDDESFQYYLPAFLKFAAVNLNHSVLDPYDRVVTSAIFSVTYLAPHNLSRLKKLTDSQIEVVILFLRFVCDHDGSNAALANNALREYWETPEAMRRTLVYVP